jgi:hypothetical protein
MLWVLTFSVTTICASNNVFIVWMALEINTYIFITIVKSQDNDCTNFTSKYYLFHSIGSVLFIIGYIFNLRRLFILSLCFKLILFPLFIWLYPDVKTLNLWSLTLLFSIQKIGPYFIFMNWRTDRIGVGKIFFTLACLNLLGGVYGVLKCKILEELLIYSSLRQSRWLLLSIYFSKAIFYFYLCAYIVLLVIVVVFLYVRIEFSPESSLRIFVLVIFSGLPPSPLFYLKVVILSWMSINNMLYVSILIFLIICIAGGYCKFFYENFTNLKRDFIKFVISHKILSLQLVIIFILTQFLLPVTVNWITPFLW